MSISNTNKENLVNLAELCGESKSSVHVVGIIIDSSCSYKTSNDYLTRIKIIDDTYNALELTNLKRDFFEICHFSSTLQKSPKIFKIGDIIYLRRYSVNGKDENRLSLETNHKAKSSYNIFEADSNSFTPVFSDHDGDIFISPSLKERIAQLRAYSVRFFAAASCKIAQIIFNCFYVEIDSFLQIIVWTKKVTKMTSWFKWNKYQTTAEGRRDFDLLLKVTSVETIADNDKDVLIRLVDSNSNQYHIQFENRQFTIGEVLKIRSVRFIEDDGTIQKSDYSNILKLPQSSWDAQHFTQSEEPTQQVETNFNTNEFSRVSSDPAEAANQYSLIKQIHLFQNENVSLQKLLELQKNPNCFADFRSCKFRVSGYVIDVYPRDLSAAVKKISYQTLSQCIPLSEGFAFDQAADLSTILEVQIVLKDESIDALQQTVNLVLIQEESQAHHDFFEGVHLKDINSATLHKYQKQFDKVINRLVNSTTILSQVEIIIQPIIFNDKLLFRIQDTQFIS